MESHNKAAKVISRVLSLPACSGTVKFMTHLQVFLLLLPVFRCVKGIKTVYVRVWVFMCMSLVFLFVALCLACSQQCLAFSLMDFFMKLCLMCVCVCECVGCS